MFPSTEQDLQPAIFMCLWSFSKLGVLIHNQSSMILWGKMEKATFALLIRFASVVIYV